MIGALFNKLLLPLAAVGLLAFAVMHVTGQKPETQAAPIAPPTHNPFPNTVAASGLIEAAAENIAVGSPVAGVVVEVFAKVGQKVSPGTPLFRLDERVLKADLNFRKAAVASAKADLTRLEHMPRPENLAMSKSQLDEAQANMLDMQDQFNRTTALVERKVSTEQELVTRRQAFHMARA
jgi:multidrug efflux pump subunit AcrA (membrane-fusion protein)